jgi:pyruvyl transferase EpsO
VVITDRLHGHILCTLLGIPHVVLDNSYGKIQGFLESFTGECELVRRAESPAEALEMAREFASERGVA